MKLKFVGESDHIVCFVGHTYMIFEKGEFVEVPELEAAKLMALHVGKFEKEESKQKAAPKTKVLPEVSGDEPSK